MLNAAAQKATILATKVRVGPQVKDEFANWQARFNEIIAAFPGFISLEILSPTPATQEEWVIIQRFYRSEHVRVWRESKERNVLLGELKTLLGENAKSIKEEELKTNDLLQGGVTEVFVTQVSPGNERAFRECLARIHQIEAKFPGFRGMYIQSPSPGQGKTWITLLQFDTPDHLDQWLASTERQKALEELKPLITTIESHQVISPYAGWFSSLASNQQDLPPVWKQTMLVLLVLFPIIMLEFKFLSPLTQHLSTTVATFIGNSISVVLIAWPMMPLAIWLLGWWLSPKGNKPFITVLGLLVVIGLYLLEIAFFWLAEKGIIAF